MMDKSFEENILERGTKLEWGEIFERDKKIQIINFFFFFDKRLEEMRKVPEKKEKKNPRETNKK